MLGGYRILERVVGEVRSSCSRETCIQRARMRISGEAVHVRGR